MVSRIFAPEVSAASFRLSALAAALAEAVDVTVLTVIPPEGADLTDPGGTPRLRVLRWPVRRDRTGYVRGYLEYMSFDLPLLVRLALTPRPEVVVVEPPPTTGAVVRLVCALRRIPYVYNAADVWSDATESTGAPRLVVGVVRALERSVLRGARAVLSVSDGVTARVRELGAREVVTVGNGVDTTVFTPEGESRGEGRFLLYAGTASEWQGADIFVRAMPQVLEQHPDARLVFLGQGSSWPRLQDLARDLAPRSVDFHLLAPPAESAAWLRGARAAVVSLRPGQKYDFAFPTKVLAALGTGTPVVYAGPGEAGELLESEGMGWRCRYDVDAVAEAMIAALDHQPPDNEGSRLARWVEANRSLRAVARRSADVVLSAGGAAAG
ncbi:glycosyltransferase [Ruania sp. N2-46]|uniref:D-inositol 3-phosphate glycosyltransferase n=2 Tax=Occultella gossypii TaxID=2800820 RepID=A0ABS7S9W9_9MICO|nr:glycosyltransferase [Occultella gossypii]